MLKQINRKEQTRKRHQRVRLKISGDAQWPRLAVYRSTKHIYAQVIDDEKGVTLASSSTVEKSVVSQMAGKTKSEQAFLVGEDVAKKALKKGVKKVVFDRAGYLYTGRVAKLAEGARNAGLEF